MGADEFYLDGGEEYADENDLEPQVVEDLDRQELDELAQSQYGLPSWSAVEQSWVEQDAQQAAAAQAQEMERLSAMYADQRLGQMTQQVLGELGDAAPDIHLPALHDATSGLLRNREWVRDHNTLTGEPLIAAALRDAIQALTVEGAQDENQGLERYRLKMQARGG
jgi:hypothetical protein